MRIIITLICLLIPSQSIFISSFKHNYRNNQQLFTMNRRNDRDYSISRGYYEKYLKHMNINNTHNDVVVNLEQHKYYKMLGQRNNMFSKSLNETIDDLLQKNKMNNKEKRFNNTDNNEDEDDEEENPFQGGFQIIINGGNPGKMTDNPNDIFDLLPPQSRNNQYMPQKIKRKRKGSDNFEILEDTSHSFSDVGGYDNVKKELMQCIDILTNYTKYAKYNVRVPKGLVLEGPPGNGKTLLAKALAGEANVSFIPVSGSQFQEKYVGVGAARIRELFKLAHENKPCIIFIDEIDALGRSRSGDGEGSSSERDNTLNELLIALDGFKEATGIFVVGATNRADLLDSALMRPGRIDKRIYITNPDEKTRREIINIHIKGKPRKKDVKIDDLIDLTDGFSGSQIENLLNEAMLLAIRDDRTKFTFSDIEIISNRMMVGWQPTEHVFSSDIIDRIAIHEMGHAVIGILSKHHSKMKKVIINLSAPSSPAYTVFEPSIMAINTREALFEHLMILLAGRIAEEVFYGVSVTTGAINDFEEAMKLAKRMILYYGMGKDVLYPSMSETYKEKIDDEMSRIIHQAYDCAEFIIRNSKELLYDGAEMLKKDNYLSAEDLEYIMDSKYSNIRKLTPMK